MKTRNPEWALEALYGEEARDLSSEGYTEAMSRLRHQDPALAGRVARALRPLRDELFSRRRVPWQETSLGRRYRVELLPDNPHYRKDVLLVRRALGLPEDQIWCPADNPVFLQLARSTLGEGEDEEVTRQQAGRELAGRWLGIHHRAFTGFPSLGSTEGLTPEAIAAARRTELAVGDLEDGGWLNVEPPDHPDCLWERLLPLHRAAALLLARYRLPRHLCFSVMIHVLTNARSDLLGLESQPVLTLKIPREIRVEPPVHALSVLVQGIDEYTTKADWDRMWDHHVAPRLEEFREARGQRPQGQQAPRLERLREGLPLYDRYLELGSLELALEEFQHADLPQGHLDDETARRLVRDLGTLLEPAAR